MAAIRTPDERLRVFVSSTLAELAPERESVREAVERLRLIPVMFELGARPHPPRVLYRAYLERSDVFVGVYWQRYGWVAPGEDVSGLEDEYRLAVGRLPQLVYIKEPSPDRDAALTTLLERIQGDDRLSYRRFACADELARLVSDDLALLLSERFHDVDPGGYPRAPAGLAPSPLDATFGREQEIEAVADIVRSGHRLVTLTGPGGIGKTRLAIEAGRALSARFGGAVVFVPLAAVHDPALVVGTIAERLGVRAGGVGSVEDLLVSRLNEAPVLLLVDNFEHLTAAAGDLASLLDRCPPAVAVVTSRHVLRVHGEREYRVPPLSQDQAALLFADRAEAVHPGFDGAPGTEQAVAEIVRRLDGLPLAIELAAGRMRVFTAPLLLERLAASVDTLGRAPADAPERQQTLRRTMNWSHELLTAAERRLFARLAAFNGGFSIGAAEAVCARPGDEDVVETLAGLVEKSLVVPVDRIGAEPRFRMLETVREYASAKLAALPDCAETERRHADWVLRLAAGGAESTGERYGAQALERVDLERANIRAAVDRAIRRGDVSLLVDIVQSTIGYLVLSDLEIEAAGWLAQAATTAGDLEAPVRARLLLYRAMLAMSLTDYVGAEALLAEARAAREGGWENPGDSAVEAMVDASVATALRTPEEALELALRATGVWAAIGSELGELYMWLIAGAVTLYREPRSAEEHLSKALALAEAMANDGLRGQCLAMLGFAARADGRAADARARFLEAADASRRSGRRSIVAFALDGLAAVALDSGRPALAVRALAASETGRRLLDRTAWAAYHLLLEEVSAAALRALTPDAAEQARIEGAGLDIAEALDATLGMLTGAPA